MTRCLHRIVPLASDITPKPAIIYLTSPARFTHHPGNCSRKTAARIMLPFPSNLIVLVEKRGCGAEQVGTYVDST